MILIQVGSRNYNAGTREFVTNLLDPSWRLAQALLTRENWPGSPTTELVTAQIDLSRDAGLTWTPLSRVGFAGGDVLDENGNIATTSSAVLDPIPDVGNPLRKLRVTVVNKQTLRTAITVEAE